MVVSLEHLQQIFYLYFLEIKCYCSHSNKFSKHKTFSNFFWSCYSYSLNLEDTVATLNEYFCLNKSYNSIKKTILSLCSYQGYKHNNPFSQTSLNSSIIKIKIQKHNLKINQTITKKRKKKKRHKPSTIQAALERKMSGGGKAEPSNPSVLSLSTSFSFSNHRES